MRSLHCIRSVVHVTAAATVLAACGWNSTSQSAPALTSLVPASTDSGRHSALTKQLLYVPSFAGNRITTYGTGRGERGPLTIVQGLSQPFAVAVDAKGKIYVTNDGTNSVTTFLPDGKQTTPTITDGIRLPFGITVDAHGKIYVVNSSPSSCSSGTVTTYLPDGTRTTPTIQILGTPVGIVVDSKGKIYVANYCAGPSGQGSVETYSPDGAPTKPILTDRDNIENPVGLWIARDKLFVANNSGSYDNSFIGYVTTYTLAGKQTSPSLATSMDGPEGIAVDAFGKIFVVNALAGAYGDITSYTIDGMQTKPTITNGIRQPNLIAIH